MRNDTVRSSSLSRMTGGQVFIAIALSLSLCVVPALAANKAVIVGPTYPGGAAFDDTIANTRANAIGASLAKWSNWNAGDISVLPGNANCNAITAAIAAAGPGMVAGDCFLFIYHGHGSFVTDDEVAPAADTCDESIWPSAHCLDDAVATSLAGLPAGVRKFVILASCYSGGFWNGSDPPGDLETVGNTCLLAGCSECQCLPEPSAFVNNLLAKIDPAGWPGGGNVTFAQFINAVMAGANGSVVNGQRWGTTLPKCPCEEPDPVEELCDFDFDAEYQLDELFYLTEDFLVNELGACCADDGTCTETTEADCDGTWLGLGTDCDPNPCAQPPIPTVSEWGLIIMTLLLLTAGTIIFGRLRHRRPMAT